jgi:hypothetical protein
MAFLEIRVSNTVSFILIVLGLPASFLMLPIGVGHLIHPETGADIVPALVLCGLGVFLLLMAIAAFRGILHRKRDSKSV